ncbi:MAG: IclR family transcriptional regulator [Reyranellaceae bacterium]
MSTMVSAARRTMEVFEVFAHERRELSNSEMARLLSVADSSSSDLLYTLHSLGYLMRTPRTRRFYPTGRLFEVARRIKQSDPLTAMARDAIERLADRTNETAFFGVLDSSSVTILAMQPSRLPLRYIVDVGSRVSTHASSLGKALLGLKPRDEIVAFLRRYPLLPVTPQTITNVDQLLAEIELSKERGWYETRGEGAEGVNTLAVSGWLGDQAVGFCLAGPAERIDTNHEAYLVALRELRASLLVANQADPHLKSASAAR